jgi:glycosyltransferase involved in cell wall biosynthesis
LPEVSLLLPALNEWGNLKQIIPTLLKLPLHQLIVIDDGSTDDTETLMSKAAFSSDPRLLYIKNEKRLGLACSVLQGIRRASGTHVLIRDSDLNHDLDDVTKLMKEAESNAGLVVASRYLQKTSYGRTNDLFSHALSRFLRWRFGAISDWTYGYFLVRRDLVDALPAGWIFRGRGEYTLRLYQILLQQNVPIAELPTRTLPRGEGLSSTNTFRHGRAYLKAILESPPAPESRIAESIRKATRKWRARGKGLAAGGHTFFGLRSRRALLKDISLAEPVLDLGCGNGAFTRSCFSSTKIIDGMDQSAEALMEASVSGYRQLWRADISRPLPITPTNYGSILCLEFLQYLEWRSLPGLFSDLRNRGASGAKLYCLVPQRYSLLHSLRKWLGRGAEDYICDHDLALLTAAASESGWKIEIVRQVGYGSKKVKECQLHAPSYFGAHVLLIFSLR